MTTVVMEYAHEPPLADDALTVWLSKLRRCLEIREVVWKHAYLSFDKKTMVCVYEASDAGMLQMVHSMIGVPFVKCLAMTEVL